MSSGISDTWIPAATPEGHSCPIGSADV